MLWQKAHTAHRFEDAIPTMKHGGGSVVYRESFSSARTGKLVRIEGEMDVWSRTQGNPRRPVPVRRRLDTRVGGSPSNRPATLNTLL